MSESLEHPYFKSDYALPESFYERETCSLCPVGEFPRSLRFFNETLLCDYHFEEESLKPASDSPSEAGLSLKEAV